MSAGGAFVAIRAHNAPRAIFCGSVDVWPQARRNGRPNVLRANPARHRLGPCSEKKLMSGEVNFDIGGSLAQALSLTYSVEAGPRCAG